MSKSEFEKFKDMAKTVVSVPKEKKRKPKKKPPKKPKRKGVIRLVRHVYQCHWKSRPLDVEEFIHLRFTKKKSLTFIASWFGFSTRGLVFRLRNEGIEYGKRIPAKRVEMPCKVDELARAKGYLSMSDLIRCLRPTHSEKQIMKMVGVSKSAVHKHTPEDIKYLYRHETEEYKRKRIERLLAARAKNKKHPWKKEKDN